MGFTWYGDVTGFGSVVLDGFFTDPNNNSYYWSANYGGLFPITINPTSGIAAYSGQGYSPVSITTGTVFTNLSATDTEVSSIASVILIGRQNIYKQNATNNIAIQTQPPSTFVQLAITTAMASGTPTLNPKQACAASIYTGPAAGSESFGTWGSTTSASGGSGIANAVNQAAPYLTDPALHFGLDDALNSWVHGPDMMTSLDKVLKGHQKELAGINNATKTIADFKKKLVNQQVALSNEIRKVQATTENFQSNNTFTHLVNTFPCSFGPLQSSLNNANSNFNKQLCSLIPGANLDLNSAMNGIMNSFVNKLYGAIKPAIMNPMDKIIADISKLEAAGDSVLANFPSGGFSSFIEQNNFVNQMANLVDNKVSNMPVFSKLSPSKAITNPSVIQNALNTALKAKLQQDLSKVPGPTAKATSALAAAMNIAGPTLASTAASAVPNTPYSGDNSGSSTQQPTSGYILAQMDSFHGGSFGNLSVILKATGGEADPNITPPTITNSPDPSIAASQNTQATAQLQADAPGTTRTTTRGAAINDLDSIPLRPRNTNVDSSTGSYACSIAIPI